MDILWIASGIVGGGVGEEVLGAAIEALWKQQHAADWTEDEANKSEAKAVVSSKDASANANTLAFDDRGPPSSPAHAQEELLRPQRTKLVLVQSLAA